MCIFLLTACNKVSDEYKTYSSYIDELKNVDMSIENEEINVEISVEELTKNYYNYKAIVDRNSNEMNDIEAILIHDKETEDAFPSVGIYEEKISLTKEDKQKGIKLSGYIKDIENITFKLLLKYKDREGNNKKYYYIYKYRQ